MKLDTFFEKFELFADTPNAVQKMRELILELAVQGKLIEQDSGDESAIEFLARLSANTRVGMGRNSKTERLLPVSESEMPFALPCSWVWCRFGELGKIGSSCRVHMKDWTAKGVPFLRAREIVRLSKIGRADNELFISEEHFQRLVKEGLVPEPDDIMITGVGTIGIPYVVGVADRFYFKDASVLIFKNNHGLPATFIRTVLQSPYWINEIHKQSMGTTVHTLTIERAKNTPFPLPPLAEQKRIVAKADELMALCDRLEAQQQQRTSQHTALARAAVSRFADAPTPANLDFIFHNAYAITPADLRKTILTLAVQGKLVPQDPSDEPAEECLQRLGLGSTADLPDEEGLLPSTWLTVRFEDIALVSGGVTLGRKLGDRKTVLLPYLRVANVKRGELDLSVMKDVSIAETEIERYSLRVNDLLMTEGGDWDKVGRAAIWRGELPVCLHQNHVFRARMRSEEIKPFWFERFLNSPVGRGYFESAAKQTTNLASINMRQVRSCPVPFPPLAEQHRIVAKVDELMKLVDQLEQQLEDCRASSDRLLDAAVHEVLQSGVTSISSLPAIDRAAIGCYALKRMQGNSSFARTAEVKVLYLAEAHLGLPLGGQYYREAAGPFDKWIYDFERQADKEGWFKATSERLSATRSITRYQLLPGIQHKVDQALEGLGDKRAEFDRVLNVFMSLSTEDIEIVGTLFAVWNDALLDGGHPDNDWIIREVRENWHSSKQRFSPEKLSTWLAWMRKHGLVPVGQGPRTVHQSGFELVD